MLKQTIIWTALPDGIDGSLVDGATVNLSAHVSPRLWSDTPETNEQLAAYPDFLNWPSKMAQATFEVDFGDGIARQATADLSKLRPDLWSALFKPETKVIPFVFEDFSSRTFENGPVAIIGDILKGVYQDAGTDPALGSGLELPKAVDLVRHPILEAIVRPFEPQAPYEPPRDEPIHIGGGEPPETDGGTGGPGAPGENGGCLSGCLLLPLKLIQALAKLLGMVLMAPFMATTNVPPGEAQSSTQQLISAIKPYQDVPEENPTDLPSAADIKGGFDFHSMVASAGDYPWLLRALGLVVDLSVTLQAPLPAADSTLKVTPAIALQMANNHQISMRTHYDLADDRFLARPRPADPEISNGLLRLNDQNRFRVMQVDAVGGGVKLINFASNLPVLGDESKAPENSPDEAGLPSLRNAGLALVKPNQATSVHDHTLVAYAHNAHVAAVDGSPVFPSASSTPPPPATDELFAEDLVRGYCVDVFDDHSQRWHSLCQREGTYDFGGGLVESDIVDEGHVVLGGTEPVEEAAPGQEPPIRLFETLITWHGWSLVAPRPGKYIMSEYADAAQTEYKTAFPSNPAKTDFPLSTTFVAVQGTLPRLRFGWKYRLRARVTDLAGNRVVEPGQPAFQDDVVEKTAETTYGRFEPVDPPPVVLKAEPALGESLERVVVSSTIHQSATDIHKLSSERHIVPPKTSQLMAEQIGRFDGPNKMLGNPAAYQLASSEAGTLMEAVDPTSGDLIPLPGTKVIKQIKTDPATGDPILDNEGQQIVVHTFYLQTNDTFVVSYLPDPFSRGVLLLGLPGVTSFEQVFEPGAGQIVNKIPFTGPWPNTQPFRLRLKGLKDGETPDPPFWEDGKRLLTVGLPQGETARVRISSYFEAADLDKMGVWQWLEETGVAELANIRGAAEQGRNWLHLPWRTLVLIHAVKQPLRLPKVTALQADKKVGATGADLTGQVTIDSKSTGKIDLRATWSDPFDDPQKGSFDPLTDKVNQDVHVSEISLAEGSPDQVTLNKLRHEIGDTKYHKVTYQALGTTRFREYFDAPQSEAEVKDMMRPAAKDIADGTAEAAKLAIDVPNSARPDVPRVLYTLPTFLWSIDDSAVIKRHIRTSGGLRVYLERTWYSSGDGELLGVLLRPEGLDPQSDEAQRLNKFVSQWGMDPLWDSARTEVLRLDHFTDFEWPRENLSLEELKRTGSGDGRGVDVIGYPVHYDDERDLWFAEVTFEPAEVTSYFPFVRLALARYHPISAGDETDSAHLSRMVRGDFVQLPPDRIVEYDTTNLSVNNSLSIAVSGPGGLRLEQPNRVVVAVEERDTRVPDEKDPLGWRQVGDLETLEPNLDHAPERVVWFGWINLPNPRPTPMRLVVREWEILPADADSTVLLPWESDQPQLPGLFENKPQRARTVFADELILP